MTNISRNKLPTTDALRSGHPNLIVVFDLDGVLVDSFEVMREAFERAYYEVVGPGNPPFTEYCSHLGRYFPDIMRSMGLPLEMEEPFVQASYELAHQVRLFPGIVDVLTRLRAKGVVMCVATGKSGDRARSLLETMGISEFFDAVVGSDEVTKPKPAADIIIEALARVGGHKEAAVMVGDATVDLISAREAGVIPIGAAWGEGDPDELITEAPAWLLGSPRDLLPVVNLLTKEKNS